MSEVIDPRASPPTSTPWVPVWPLTPPTPPIVLISEQVLASAGSFSFQSIPQTYRHLQLFGVLRGDNGAPRIDALVRCNNDSATNYMRCLYHGYGAFGMGGTALDGQTAGILGYPPAAGSVAGWAGAFEATFPFYTQTAFWHGFVSRMFGTATSDPGVTTWSAGGEWKNTAAITRLDIIAATGNWLAGSRVALYGLT